MIGAKSLVAHGARWWVTAAFALAIDAALASDFAIRADPASQAAVTNVLARFAAPVTTRLPAGATGAAYLAARCGEAVPASTETAVADGTTVLRFTPCQRQPAGHPAPATAEPGVSPWTEFSVPDAAIGRARIAAALASALKCGAVAAETCLQNHQVTLLEVQKSAPPAVVGPVPPPVASPAFSLASPQTGLASLIGALDGLGTLANSTLRSQDIAAAIVEATPSRPVRVLPSVGDNPQWDAPVAPEQWPYDADLVRQVLKHAAAIRGAQIVPVAIGVADNALADRDGFPLPAAIFAHNGDEPGSLVDDDGNGYDDDIIGAGRSRRHGEVLDGGTIGDADIGICAGQRPDFATWGEAERFNASHGSIVASIAAGLPLRSPDSDVAMPKLIFYRMIEEACSPKDSGQVDKVYSAKLAVNYLTDRSASIVNLSYNADTDLADALRDKTIIGDWLLVAPAGNVVPAGNADRLDLDRDPAVCPPCMVSEAVYNPSARFIVVVGAAGADLRITNYTGFGRAVSVFAPAVPTGALDIGAAPVPQAGPGGTSWAAPYASLAAAIIRSVSNLPVADVKLRMQLATWPLFVDSGSAPVSGTGVLDLVKASAVLRTSVEYLALEAGRWVRRTAVGSFLETPGYFTVCNQTVPTASIQAIRFTAMSAGMRQAKKYSYARKKFLNGFKDEICEEDVNTAQGKMLKFYKISGDTIEIDRNNITYILFPMRLN